MKGKTQAALALLLLWIAGSAAAFYWFFLSHYGVFDVAGKWQQQPLQPTFVQQTFNHLLKPDQQWQAILITEESCSCSSFAKDHLQRMLQRLPNLIATNIDLQTAEQSGLTIVATPLLLLFERQQLLYAGPLATDMLCSDNASLLEGILSGTSTLPGFWLNGESTACRCPQP